MRMLFLSVIAAASALTMSAPASAQWAAPAYNYHPYNYGYGFNGFHFARSMEARVERIRGDIREMQARRILSWREARNLEGQAGNLQDRIYRASRNGIQPGEGRRLESQIRSLEYRVSREASDWNDRPGRYGHYSHY